MDKRGLDMSASTLLYIILVIAVAIGMFFAIRAILKGALG